MTSHLLPTYARVDLAFERGEGVWLVATDGERYLDFTSGVAVNALGHAHPHLIAAVTAQANKVWHVSNLYQAPQAERVAQRLCDASFADVVFFCNSGAEAMECTIKTARKYHAANGAPQRYRTITFEGAFHGRTLATLAAGGQKKYLDGFGPVVEGFDQVPFADLAATKAAITAETAAILIEPIMGEGGVRVVEPPLLRALREVCDQNGLLLLFDEVQTGMGRTGKLFGYHHSGIRPDIITLAKALGGGIPIGAMVARAEVASVLTPGTHGSTFGGNPVACAAALAVFDALEQDGVIANAAEVGQYLITRLREISKEFPNVREVRGQGMIIGIALKHAAKPVVDACFREHLIVNGTADTILRLLPPLTLTREEADTGLGIIKRALHAEVPAGS